MNEFNDPRDRFTLQAEREFRPSVRPIYRSIERRPEQPEHLASCLLLSIDGIAIVCTAAHVADNSPKHTLYIGGEAGVGVRLVYIPEGAFSGTIAPAGDRDLDYFDIAFWPLPASAIAALGAVVFLDSSRLTDQMPTENRLYTAMGYPRSRNKTKVNHSKKSIDTRISMYTANVEQRPALAAELGISGADHLFLSGETRSFAGNSGRVNTFGPRGLSGGAVLDLGEFAPPEFVKTDSQTNALLSGMIIEYYEEHRALMAVRISLIVASIRRALAQDGLGAKR